MRALPVVSPPIIAPARLRARGGVGLAVIVSGCLAPLDDGVVADDGIATSTVTGGAADGDDAPGSSSPADGGGDAGQDGPAADADSGDPSDGAETTDTATDPPPVAPDGYTVVGNTVFDADGQPHVFRGVARPSLEWSSTGEGLAAADYQAMAGWGANVVRIALNQGFWLAGSSAHDAAYPSLIDQQIAWAHDAGLDVILDLHWSDRGDPSGALEQQRMADARSITFWSEVAARYADDGRVLFELYNEPHDVSWAVWRDGGPTGEGWDAVGMQSLYAAVRDTGADNVVIVGGLDWAYDLSGVPGNEIDGYNVMYATHPYDFDSKQPAAWDADWGFLTATHAVIATEFGSFDCDASYSAALLEYAAAREMSWTAWAWYPGGCKFPALIENWNAAPSAAGALVRDALMGN
jgi:endoglucanase